MFRAASVCIRLRFGTLIAALESGMGYSIRNAARAIILTPQHEVLLMRMSFPWRLDHLWILPGGGIEQDEEPEAAVVREVYEETGATTIEVVGEAWRRESFVAATMTHLKQRYYLVFSDHFVPKPAKLSEQEMEWVREYRWWSLHSLRTEKPNVEPERIALGLQDLIKHGLPPNPVEIDIQ